MDTGSGKSHTDREYEQQLKDLRNRLQEMGATVENMIERAVRALTDGDADLARKTIELDAKVNQDELEADHLCLVILAKRQPMASDLRFITLALKMVTDLERIGDLAVNISERAIDLAGQPQIRPWSLIPKMADLARIMVNDAIDAFIESDASKARAVIARDDRVDTLYTQAFREVLAVMAGDPETLERGIHVQSIAKWLERIADHATNLAEQVIFMVGGKDVRHSDLQGD